MKLAQQRERCYEMGEQQDFGEIIVYQTDDGLARVDVLMENDSVWLSKSQMAELFQRDRTTIGRHIQAVFSEGELDEKSNVQKMHVPNSDRPIELFRLDVIIAVGYRVKSQRGTQFRQWATARLKEYMVKGFTLDDDRLKGTGGGNYWKELLARIRDIRSSEKMLYRQVLDLYATSTDYNPKSADSIRFFQMVQNKLHYAAHGHTAAEVVYERADANQPFMGLKSFSGELPVLRDVVVAKNYLDAQELQILNNLVSGYFDLAEIAAIEHRPMTMHDYVVQLDAVLSSGGRKLLTDSGSISHDEAMEKARTEYRKYQAQTLSPVEEAYLETIKSLEEQAKKKSRENKS